MHSRGVSSAVYKTAAVAAEPRRQMVEHQGIAPCIPVWKTGVYLSTLMLEKVIINASLLTSAAPVDEIGIPCGNCTRLCGVADRRLG